jgi:hypothetical protein
MERKIIYSSFILLFFLFMNCKQTSKDDLQSKVDQYASVRLSADLNTLTEKEKLMLPLLLDAAKIMDELYWQQAYPQKDSLLTAVKDDAAKKFIMINYGPWERLAENTSFIEGIGAKPAGGNFYPLDMTKAEFDSLKAPDKTNLYTVIRRDQNRNLISVPYHIEYKAQLEKASELVKKASELAEDAGLKTYLELRSQALLTSDYFSSDTAWMDMKTNNIDFVVGPIENYEDQLFGYKAAFESFVLLKDKDWSAKLAHFAALLPELQKKLPVEDKYKKEVPGSSSDIGVYNVVYYGGDCNAGSKTIAINLPNDEKVHALKGSRKLQLKNALQAKFDKILLPIGNLLIAEDQRKNIKFNAFFENVMFHEVSHGLGISKVLTDSTLTVRHALKETASSIEEGKADILGLYLVSKLYEMGQLSEGELMDNFVTFMAGIFRSVRFGAASAHGKANMMCFYYFEEKGAFTRDAATGTYRVDFEKMKEAMTSLAENILVMQGNGDYEGAKKVISEKGNVKEELQKDLDRIKEAGIPRDIVFEQGKEVLGL